MSLAVDDGAERSHRRGLWAVPLLAVCGVASAAEGPLDAAWRQADARGQLYAQCMERADRVLKAWLKVIDPKTGLTPQTYRRDGRWTVANSAADLYSSLVMAAAFSDREALNGVLKQALASERKHALRIGVLPDDLDLKTLAFLRPEPSLRRSTYGAAEWCRDGLLRITEILGPGTPWATRLTELTDGVMVRAAAPTRFGPVPRGDHEVDGEMLQVLARLYALTGERRYRTWAERIGDYHLFEKLPQKSTRMCLRDHGGEIISGLAELYVMTAHADPKKAARYRPPLRDLLDRVLEVGRAPDGMLYLIIDPLHGKVVSKQIIDTWGYIYNAHLTYDMATGERRYREAVEKVLRVLPERYMEQRWRRSDDYADSIESALVLHNRLRVPGVEAWIATMIPRMWAMQEPDGTVNRRYDDGSFARTSILVAGFLSQGLRPEPWRRDLRLGAVARDGSLFIWLRAEKPWAGRLVFDRARSRVVFHLPINYPRINELPEWHVVSEKAAYDVTTDGEGRRVLRGSALAQGLPIRLLAGRGTRIIVAERR